MYSIKIIFALEGATPFPPPLPKGNQINTCQKIEIENKFKSIMQTKGVDLVEASLV